MIFIYITVVLCCAFWAYVIPRLYAARLYRIRKRLGRRRLKPFDCSPCLGFWLTLIMLSIMTQYAAALLLSVVVFFALRKIEQKKQL